MTTSVQYYRSLEEQLGEALSTEGVEFTFQTNEKKIDVATCALDYYLGWLYDDLNKLNEVDKKTGNVTSYFIHSLPDVGTEEPEDDAERLIARQSNKLFAKYYVEQTDGKDPKLVDFYDNAALFSTEGREINVEVQALDQLIGNTSHQFAPDSAWSKYNGWSKIELETRKGYLKSRINTLSDMVRKAIHIGQQWTRFQTFVPNFGKVPGLRVILNNEHGSEALARTKQPFKIEDTMASGGAYSLKFSVSSFLNMDVPKAVADHQRTGHDMLACLKATLKHGPASGEATGGTFKIDELGNVWHRLYDTHTSVDKVKGIDHRMLDAKKGSELSEYFLRCAFEVIVPTLGIKLTEAMVDPTIIARWKQIQTKDIEKAHKEQAERIAAEHNNKQTDETPAAKAKRRLAEARSKLRAS